MISRKKTSRNRRIGRILIEDYFRAYFVLPALRGGFVGLAVGFLTKYIIEYKLLSNLSTFPIPNIIILFIILVIPFLWMMVLEKHEQTFVYYSENKKIANPYLCLFSMTYFIVNLPLITQIIGCK